MEYLKENEKAIATFCLLHRIDAINVTFDGSGDCGAIDDVEFWTGNTTMDVSALEIQFWKSQGNIWDPETTRWVQGDPIQVTEPVNEMVKQHVLDLLERSGIDWYNNDGGYGSWEWTSATGITEFKVYQRVTQSDLVHSSEYSLGTAEEDGEESTAQGPSE